jgi:ribonuclease E
MRWRSAAQSLANTHGDPYGIGDDSSQVPTYGVIMFIRQHKTKLGSRKIKASLLRENTMKKEMLINSSQDEECRIAIIEDGRLEELYVERASQDNYVGNIYKGKVVNLEPSIQAVFVDFGVGRNGFLHISDVEPSYFKQGGFDSDQLARTERGGNGRRGGGEGFGDDDEHDDRRRRAPYRGARPRFKPPIQEVFHRGDEVLVQVIKEGIGNKGPTLSTYISIPGRYLVLMPALGRVGVSRKIEDEDERRRLKDILLDLNPPRGVGFIVRTAGAGRSRKELSRDLAYLLRLWKVIVRRTQKAEAPLDIYEESDMIIRTIRDIVSADIDMIHVDRESAYERAKEFLKIVMPRQVNKLQLYKGKDPLFHRFDLEEEIARIYSREVPLPDGGSIVIDQTEALVAIDVNSGNFRVDDSAEETAFRLNLAAAKEISRQLRLRDLGGVIVNDFIDMRRERHRRDVERALRDAMKRDRARTKILRTSPFGLIEMTRQRIRPGLKRSTFNECPCCSGRGVVKTAESMSLEVIRMLLLAAHQPKCTNVMIRVNDAVASFLNNQKRKELSALEDEGKMRIRITGSENVFPEHLEMKCQDDRGNEIKLSG